MALPIPQVIISAPNAAQANINANAAFVASALSLADTFLLGLLETANVQFADAGFNINRLLPNSYNYASTPQVFAPIFSAGREALDTRGIAAPVPADSTFSAVSNVFIPDLNAVQLPLDLPSVPSATLPGAPTPVDFVLPDIPVAPLLGLPATPIFDALVLPPAPSIDLPSFRAVLPADDLLVPTNSFTFYEEAYDSALLNGVKAKLLFDLQNGGYGLEPADEAALWDRLRDRETEGTLIQVDEAYRISAARGFPLPPGEVTLAVERAQRDLQNKLSSASREVALKRADLYVENRRFVLEQSKELENILLGFHNSRMERALNVAKATLEASLTIYDALVKRYAARLDAYKAEAATFSERIRGELAKAEIYRTQIAAVGEQVAMNRGLVDIYRAQLDGVTASVNIYRTQMDAANVRAGIERNKLDAYRALVDGYVAQVQAKSAEFGLYRARIDGETAKVNIFETQVRAFTEQVNAAKTRSDIQLGVLTAESEQARIKLANFQGRLGAYEAEVRRQLDTNRLRVETYRTDVEATKAYNEAVIAKNKLQTELVTQTTTQNTEISRVAIANAHTQMLAVVEGLKFRMGAQQYGADKNYALITSLVNAMSTLVSQSTTT
ncbi:MAG: hypothetical protein DDT20_00677 [Firmicutes bacterium]|nr:hypothetical protein [Bacillota bacterium]